MYITLEADYAVRIMVCLAKAACSGGKTNAKSVSEQTNVNLRFALKILSKLVLAGLVQSFKGTNGGYKLAKTAQEISLYDVISVVDGDCYMSRCVKNPDECARCSTCKTQKIYKEISGLIFDRLSQTKIDTLIDE